MGEALSGWSAVHDLTRDWPRCWLQTPTTQEKYLHKPSSTVARFNHILSRDIPKNFPNFMVEFPRSDIMRYGENRAGRTTVCNTNEAEKNTYNKAS
eukprot:g78372.t1